MTFGKTLRKHLTMALSKHFTVAASAIVFYIAIDYRNKTNMRVAASNVKYISCFLYGGLLASV